MSLVRWPRWSLITALILLLGSSHAYSANTHATSSEAGERQAWFGDGFTPYVHSGCLPAVPRSSLTFTAFPCTAYVRGATADLVFVQQDAISLTLTAVDGLHWIALHRDTSSAVSGWTRRAESHYLFQQYTPAQPADPVGGLVVARVTVAGGVITAVYSVANPNPVLSTLVSVGKNVKECGAKVDGVADDTVALNTCLATYSHVFVPAGVLKHSGTVVINVGNRLSGVQVGLWDTANVQTGQATPPLPGTTLRYTGSGTAVSFAFTGTVDSLVADCQCTIENLLIRSTTGSIGIAVNLVQQVRIYNIQINGQDAAGIAATGFTTAGIKLSCTGTNPNNQAFIGVHIDHAMIHYTRGYGILSTGCQNANSASITGSIIRGNRLGGLVADSRSAAWEVSHNVMEGNGGYQLFTVFAEGWNILSNYFEVTPTDGTAPMIWLKICQGCSVRGNIFRGGGSTVTPAAILLGEAANGFLVSGTSIENNSFERVGIGVSVSGARNTSIQHNACPGDGSVDVQDVITPVGGSFGSAMAVNWIDCGSLSTGNLETLPVVSGMSTTIVSVSNTTAETVLYSHTIHANSLSVRSGLQVALHGSMQNISSGPADFTIRVKYGGVTLSVLRWQALASGGASRAFVLRGTIIGSTRFGVGHQACYFEGLVGAVATVVNTVVDTGATQRFHTCSAGTTGADMTVAQTLEITTEMSVAAATVDTTKESVYLVRLPY